MKVEVVTLVRKLSPLSYKWVASIISNEGSYILSGIIEGVSYNDAAGHLMAFSRACESVGGVESIEWRCPDKNVGSWLIFSADQWKENGWRTRAGKPVRYPEIWSRALSAKQKARAISFSQISENDPRIKELETL